MLLFIFAQKHLLLKLAPLKNSPFKGSTLHAEVCVCLKKRENYCYKIYIVWIHWMTNGKCCKNMVFIKCIFKLILQWINLMQIKGRENGMERVTHVELILPSRNPHDCTQFNPLWLFYNQTLDTLISIKSGGREESQNGAENPW